MTKNPKTQSYWFKMTVTFTCPHCGKANQEIMHSKSSTANPDKIAAAVTTQSLKCKSCSKTPTDGTQIGVNVLPISEAEGLASRSPKRSGT